MPLVRPCRAYGCDVLTMGEFCIEHEQPVQAVVRGQLFVMTREHAQTTTSPVKRVASLRTASVRPAAAQPRR